MNKFIPAILIRVLAVSFYQLYTGIFLLIFYFAFGIMRTGDHLTLATYLAQNTFLLTGTLVIFSGYVWVTYRFVHHELDQEYNRFLYDYVLFSPFKRWTWLSMTQLVLNFPVFIYASFVVYFSPSSLWYHYLVLLAFCIINLYFPVKSYLNQLEKPKQKRKYAVVFRIRLPEQLKKPVSSWFPLELLHNKPLFLLINKFATLSVLFFFLHWYLSGQYDWRLPAIGVLISFSISGLLIYQYLHFRASIYWWNNLPLSPINRLLIDFKVFTWVNLLELSYLIFAYFTSLGFYQVIILMVYAQILMMTLNVIIVRYKNLEDKVLYIWSMAVFVQFILILFKVPAEVFIIAGLILILVNRNMYYRI